MLDQTPSPVKSSRPYTIRLNAAAGEYEFWNGRKQGRAPVVGHPAYWLAYRTAEKHPDLAAVAWRGAEVVARGRVSLSFAPNAFTRATIANSDGSRYTVAWEYVTDYENWEYVDGKPVNPQVRVTTCTCEAYQRQMYTFNGQTYCKHMWAEQAQRTIEALSRALADVFGAMARISQQEPVSCWRCGRELNASNPASRFGDTCADEDGCMSQARINRQLYHQRRSTQWALQGERRFREYCNSALGAQAYVLKAMANSAPTIRPDKVRAAYGTTD